jgi:hypothetical protein
METKTLTLYTVRASEYQIRQETFEGRRHLVVPVVMMVEGVHNGSRGPLLHTAEELGRFVNVWDGIPITIQHPQSDGVFVSANSPEQLGLSVGRVFNTHLDGDKLRAEAWLDESKLIAISPEALEYIRQGKPLDVSVGVFNDEIPETGEWNDEHYEAIATNHRPDHLALLPGGRGACSWEDGCGIRVNKEGGNMEKGLIQDIKSLNQRGYAAIPIVNKQGYRELMETLRSKLDAMDTADRMYFLVEVYENEFVYEVRSRETESSTLYKRGYSTNENDEIEVAESPVEVRRKVEFVTMSDEKRMKRTKFNNNNKKEGGNEMACCEDKVDRLIANAQTKFTANDKEWLLAQSEETIDKLFPNPVKEEKKEDQPQVNREMALEVLNLQKPEDYLALMPEKMKSNFETGLKLYQDSRKEKIDSIVENSEFAAEDLSDYTDAVLDKLFNSFNKSQGNYAGNGSTKIKINAQQETEEMLLPPGVE